MGTAHIHAFFSFCLRTLMFLDLLKWGHLHRTHLLLFSKLKPLYYSKNSHWGVIYIQQNERIFCVPFDELWQKHTLLEPGTYSPIRIWSISILPERSLEATLFLNYLHLNVFAWKLSKPNVWEERLIIHHHLLQTQVVKVLKTVQEGACAGPSAWDGRFY